MSTPNPAANSAAGANPKSRRLGRGLSALLNENPPVPVNLAPTTTSAPPAPAAPTPSASGGGASAAPTSANAATSPASGAMPPTSSRFTMIPTAAFEPNRFQPRRSFDETTLRALADSIRVSGMMQPIVARRSRESGAYEIIAGERRWRAAKLLNLAFAPTLIVELSDQEAAEWALVENMQREDLNPLDRARALHALSQVFGLTQSQIADRTGLERSTIANNLRLLELEPPILELLESNKISGSHARALASALPGKQRIDLAKRCAQAGWSVHTLEDNIRIMLRDIALAASGRAPKRKPIDESAVAGVRALERDIAEALGTRVKITTDRTGKKGRVMIDFYDLDQFDGLLQKFGVSPS